MLPADDRHVGIVVELDQLATPEQDVRKRRASTRSVAVHRLCDQEEIGPSGVAAQSKSRTRWRISPLPAKSVRLEGCASMLGGVAVIGFTATIRNGEAPVKGKIRAREWGEAGPKGGKEERKKGGQEGRDLYPLASRPPDLSRLVALLPPYNVFKYSARSAFCCALNFSAKR